MPFVFRCRRCGATVWQGRFLPQRFPYSSKLPMYCPCCGRKLDYENADVEIKKWNGQVAKKPAPKRNRRLRIYELTSRTIMNLIRHGYILQCEHCSTPFRHGQIIVSKISTTKHMKNTQRRLYCLKCAKQLKII